MFVFGFSTKIIDAAETEVSVSKAKKNSSAVQLYCIYPITIVLNFAYHPVTLVEKCFSVFIRNLNLMGGCMSMICDTTSLEPILVQRLIYANVI